MLLKKAKHHKSNYKLYSKGFSPHYPLPGYLRHPVAAFEAITSWMLSISNCIILDHLAMILLMDTKDNDYPIIHRVLTCFNHPEWCRILSINSISRTQQLLRWNPGGISGVNWTVLGFSSGASMAASRYHVLYPKRRLSIYICHGTAFGVPYGSHR